MEARSEALEPSCSAGTKMGSHPGAWQDPEQADALPLVVGEISHQFIMAGRPFEELADKIPAPGVEIMSRRADRRHFSSKEIA